MFPSFYSTTIGWILKTGRLYEAKVYLASNDPEDASCVHQLAITLPPEFVAETNVADKTRVASIYKKRRRKTGTFRANAYSYNDATGGSKWHELICINPAITVDSGSLERLVPQFIRRSNPLLKILKKQ